MLHSLSAQISYYSEYIQKQPEWLYCGVYVDEAVTGTKSERPEFLRLLSDCRAGKIDMIITKSISRFARNTVTLLATVRELKAIGVDVFFEEPHIHTMSAAGEMMLTLLASVAQEESRMTSERMKWRVRKNFTEGVPWNVTILGYTLRNGRFVVVPEEAAVVRQIFDLYLDGKGYAAIADILNASDAKTRYGRTWNHTSVRWVLRNYAYYDTFADALAAWTDGSTLKLMADVTYNSEIAVPADTSKTLDLNGKTLSSDTPMSVAGTLTVQSSTTGGNIIHTAASQVIRASSGATVNINSGTITGYNADRAVIKGTGTFNLNGGKIATSVSNAFVIEEGSTLNLNAGEIECTSGSTSMGTASAILAHGNTTINWVGTAIRTNTGNGITIKSAGTGTVNVSGGSFTATNSNPPANGGYAVYNDSKMGTLNLKGNPDFTGKGIYLANDKVIHITGELSNTTPIGVAMETPGVFTSGLAGNGNKDNFAFGNGDDYVVVQNDAGEIMLYSVDQLAADEVIDAIDAIGEVEYTTACKAKIDAARAKYNALTTDQQALVTNAATLTDAETEYAALEAAAAALATAKMNATNTVNAVNASDYIAADQQTVTNAKNTALAAIETAATEAEVTAAVEAFNAVRTSLTKRLENAIL